MLGPSNPSKKYRPTSSKRNLIHTGTTAKSKLVQLLVVYLYSSLPWFLLSLSSMSSINRADLCRFWISFNSWQSPYILIFSTLLCFRVFWLDSGCLSLRLLKTWSILSLTHSHRPSSFSTILTPTSSEIPCFFSLSSSVSSSLS